MLEILGKSSGSARAGFPSFVKIRLLQAKLQLTSCYSLAKCPAPFPAQFSNLWLMWQCRHGRRYQAVEDAHQKYGKVVRIQPNHVSIADDKAINIIYGHGNGFLKAEYYDAFVSIKRGLFNVRDRAEHTRKRKIVSHTFSAKSIGQFEQYIHANLELFLRKWSQKSTEAKARGGYASLDALNWFNYLAFDIIGDLAFGAPFGVCHTDPTVSFEMLTQT